MLRALAPLAAAAAVMLVPAASASASTRLVAPSGTDAGACLAAPGCKTITYAVGQAADGDTVKIAAGAFHEAVDSSKTLAFVGAGAGTADGYDPQQTTFVDAQSTGSHALRLDHGGSVSHLRLRGGGTQGSYASSGLYLQANGVHGPRDYAVSDVVATTGINGSGAAVTIEGAMWATATAKLDHVTAISHDEGLAAFGTTSVDLRHALLRPGPGGTALSAGGYFTGADIVTDDGAMGAYGAMTSGNVTLVRSRLAGHTAGVRVMAGTTTLRDSLVRAEALADAPWPQAGLLGDPVSGYNGVANVANSTVVGVGAGVDAAADVHTQAAGTFTATFSGSVLWAQGAPDLLADKGTASADHSLFSTVKTVNGGTAPAAGSGTNRTGDPGFVDVPAGDFHLGAGSPARDLADAGALVPGEADLDGVVRPLPGSCAGSPLPDAGAYEASADCPTPPPAPTPATPDAPDAPPVAAAPAPDRTPPAITKLSRRGRTLRFRLSERATVTIRVRHRVLRRVTLSGGTHRVRLPRLRPGRHRLTITAVDAAGNRSAARRLRA